MNLFMDAIVENEFGSTSFTRVALSFPSAPEQLHIYLAGIVPPPLGRDREA